MEEEIERIGWFVGSIFISCARKAEERLAKSLKQKVNGTCTHIIPFILEEKKAAEKSWSL